MPGKVVLRLLPFLALFAFRGYQPGPVSPDEAVSMYNEADRLFNLAETTTGSDEAALAGFHRCVAVLQATPAFPAKSDLLYQSFYKQGVLHEVYGRYMEATHNYVAAISYAGTEEEKLKIDVFAGAGYYKLNNFDSANYYLLQAEQNAAGLSSADDRVRLFNSLGVLYYDNGNYLQSKNYFTQALGGIPRKNATDRLNALSVELNIASCYYRLGLFEKALDIYRPAATGNLLHDQIFINMGKAYVGQHDYAPALQSFRKVNAEKLPGVWNDMAGAALAADNLDSAKAWIFKFQLSAGVSNSQDAGINALYEGELRLKQGDPQAAILSFHRSVILFSGNFKNSNIRSNPESFSGTFAYYRLFEAMYRKAAAWETLYAKTHESSDLEAAYSSYMTTLSLLSYIERSYEMDDAKILLKQNSGQAYEKAFQLCIKLNDLHPASNYLEEAFRISEKRKASVVAGHIREQHFQSGSLEESLLLRQERNLKFNLSRRSAHSGEKSANGTSATEDAEKTAYENQLVAVQKQLKKSSRYYEMKYQDDYPTVQELRARLSERQALISLTQTDSGMNAFILTREKFSRVDLGSDSALRSGLTQFVRQLQDGTDGVHFDNRRLDASLISRLVAPIDKQAAGKPEWLIVPDGLFFSVPFEALPANTRGERLLEKHAISYLLSARFLPLPNTAPLAEKQTGMMAFAPFAAEGADLQDEGLGTLARLPASRAEITGLPGDLYFDSAATKKRFVAGLNKYPIIHLATHAVADLTDPQSSFIAFYPAEGMRGDDNLFLGELYGLHMDSCKLIIMSACETGKGRLQSEEGVMSFARAFSYAGCPSTVTSLWKADDKSTAEILEGFYRWLDAGYSKAEALQKAKLDFMKAHPMNRDPRYWSHLVLTGDATPLFSKKQPWGWAVALLCLLYAVGYLVYRKRKSPASR